MVNVICHCADCSYFQANTYNTLFPEGAVKITKGLDKVRTFKHPRLNITLRVFCNTCGVYCFARALQFGMVGMPYDRHAGDGSHLRECEAPFHVNYHNKRMVMKDGKPKFRDFPSVFGGSGDILNDEGDAVIANDKTEAT